MLSLVALLVALTLCAPFVYAIAAMRRERLRQAEAQKVAESERLAQEARAKAIRDVLAAFCQRTVADIQTGKLPTAPKDNLTVVMGNQEVLHWTCAAALGRTRRAGFETLDSGKLWFTDKRFGFLGRERTFEMGYSSIASFQLGKDVLRVSKRGREIPDIYETDAATICEALIRHYTTKS